jgi:hypothetical protein
MVVLLAVAARAEGAEKKVTLEQVPEKVRTAIQNAVGDGRLVDIGEFREEEGCTYEIEMVVDGKEYDVLFAEDGKVLGKSFEGRVAGSGGQADEDETEELDEQDEDDQHEREGPAGDSGAHDGFQDTFDLESREFATTGRNRYFILEPGYRLVLEGKEGEHTVRLAVTVLDETREVGGIETRVVEERESVGGDLVEISRNFFARCTRTGSIFYFGEEVDVYEDGEVVAHEGEWLHGEDGARAGMMMPGEPLLGAGYYQEVAPGKAMDRARIVDVAATLETPAGEFRDCLKCREENPLDREREFKIHAPGVGLIQDEGLLLVEYGFAE